MDDPHRLDDDAEEDELIAMDLLNPQYVYNEERNRQKWVLRVHRRGLRDARNPFDVTYESFVSSYRLSQDLALSLIDVLRPFVRPTTSALAVPLELKVLSVLSFYASGSYQTPTGKQFDCPIAQPTLSGYITEVTNALNEDAILTHFIRFPSTVQELNHCIERNQNLGGQLPNVVGCTDGTLIKIKSPSLANNKHAFTGRKGVPCINAQITCDRRMYITNVVPNFPGSTADSFIFTGSALRHRMINFYNRRRCHLLGDTGYAQQPWMLTPFRQTEDNTPESRYNKAHCSDRNVVERTIGLLKERWRCINDERTLHYDYVKVAQFINGAVVLHNLCVLANLTHYAEGAHLLRNVNVNEEEPEEDDDDLDDEDVPEGRRQQRAILIRGQQVRQEIVNELELRRQKAMDCIFVVEKKKKGTSINMVLP